MWSTVDRPLALPAANFTPIMRQRKRSPSRSPRRVLPPDPGLHRQSSFHSNTGNLVERVGIQQMLQLSCRIAITVVIRTISYCTVYNYTVSQKKHATLFITPIPRVYKPQLPAKAVLPQKPGWIYTI